MDYKFSRGVKHNWPSTGFISSPKTVARSSRLRCHYKCDNLYLGLTWYTAPNLSKKVNNIELIMTSYISKIIDFCLTNYDINNSILTSSITR